MRPARRRRLRPKRLLAVLALLAALAAVFEVLEGPFFRLHHVAVRGGPQGLWRLSGLRFGVPLFSVRTAAADEQLLQKARYLATAAFERQWPDRLVLTVSYRSPVVVAAGVGGSLYGVDRTGRVLGKEPQNSGLPVLQGVAASLVHPYADLPQAAAAAAALAFSLHEAGFTVSEVVPGTTPQIYLPSGTEVFWPPAANTRKTLAELEAILAALQRRQVVAASIDLRLPQRPLVVLRK